MTHPELAGDDKKLEQILSGEKIRFVSLATESPLQTIARKADEYMVLAQQNGVEQVTFQVSNYEVTVKIS